MSSTTISGFTGPVWGTVGDATIIVDNIRESYGSEWEELANGDGDIVAAVAHGKKGEVTMDFVMTNKTLAQAKYLLAPGANITLPDNGLGVENSTNLYVVSWEQTRSKGGFMSGTLTANLYPNMS